MDILFVCIAISTVSLVHSNGLLKEMALITVLATAGVRVLFKKLVTSDESALSQQKSQEIEDLQERVEEEVRHDYLNIETPATQVISTIFSPFNRPAVRHANPTCHIHYST